MKSKFTGFAAFLLSLFLLAGLFSACGGNPEPNAGTQTQSAEETDLPAAPLRLAENGETGYVILRGNKASSAVVSAASRLWSAFRDRTGTAIDLCDEWRYEEKGSPAAIVVGVISDETSVRLREPLRYDDYRICAEESNLYLIGGSDEATVAAVEWFLDNYLKRKTDSLVLESDFDIQYRKDYPVRSLTVGGTDIAAYRIVYPADTYYPKANAEELRNLIATSCGVTLEVVPDTKPAVPCEILVGNPNREEIRAIAQTLDQPNLYYFATVRGTKPILFHQGVRTGETLLASFKSYFGRIGESRDLTAQSLNLSGNVKSVDKSALARPAGTDIRILQSNVLGTFGAKENGFTDQQRAELLADTFLLYYPDVITLNEMFPDHSLPPLIEKLISPYYNIISDAPWLGLFTTYANSPKTYSCPVAYRKDAGLTPLSSGFNYLSDGVDFHGCAWTVFQTAGGYRFLAASAHLSQNVDADGKHSTRFVEDVLAMVNVARRQYGDLPMVLNGDWYFWQTGYAKAYNYMVAQGMDDVSETAVTKHSVGVGTYHDIGKDEQHRAEEDLIFVTPAWFKALSHKIIVDYYTVNSSDHYPVFADLQFAKPATETAIPPFAG